MNDQLRIKITAKLTTYLNREPSNDEVTNAQTDTNIMHWIAQDDAIERDTLIESIALAANLDFQTLKEASKQVL